MSHTKTPWTLCNAHLQNTETGDDIPMITAWDEIAEESVTVCLVSNDAGEQRYDNARLIVRAVNSHEAMKEALEKLIAYWEKTGPQHCQYDKLQDFVDMGKRALLLAEGKEPQP